MPKVSATRGLNFCFLSYSLSLSLSLSFFIYLSIYLSLSLISVSLLYPSLVTNRVSWWHALVLLASLVEFLKGEEKPVAEWPVRRRNGFFSLSLSLSLFLSLSLDARAKKEKPHIVGSRHDFLWLDI